MNDFPSPAPVQAPPQRKRRSGRTAARKRKKGFALWQWAVLSVLACGLLIACAALYNANGSLIKLRQERLAAQEKYEKTVRNHQPRYRDLIEKYAAEYDLNPAYVSAIIMQESGFDPKAVSSKGAMGLMQFMPNTFDWVAPNCGISKNDVNAVYEPENAIKMGCYLLRSLCRKLESDDPVLVACAYHAGWGTVPSWIEN